MCMCTQKYTFILFVCLFFSFSSFSQTTVQWASKVLGASSEASATVLGRNGTEDPNPYKAKQALGDCIRATTY